MNKTRKLTLTALMAALCYVAFTYLQIKIPTPAGYTSFHLGNVFCVLAGMLLDGPTGGLAGAIGLGIGDLLDPVYIITAPKTIILKYTMGYIAGYLAHNVFKLEERSGKDLVTKVFLTVGITMLFNVIFEPAFSYLYYDVILGNSEKAKSYLMIAKWITTGTNAILTTILASPLYVLLRDKIK